MKDRRDLKNRVLRTGEYQDPRTGRYLYKYIDPYGNRRTVYSWKLVPTDSMPKGKQKDISLREKIGEIKKSLDDGIRLGDANITVLELVKKYTNQKTNVRHNTIAGYKTVIKLLENDNFGKLPISKIKPSDAKVWLKFLQEEKHKGYSSIHVIKGVLKPAFQMAFDDFLIKRNPFDFPLSEAVYNNSIAREAISREQEKQFLKFIRYDDNYSKYYEGMLILFKTGLRISEFTGLTISDIDIENRRIKVDHQLQRTRDMKYIIIEPKTEAGTRYVPMSKDVVEAFQTILENRVEPSGEKPIDGYCNFLYYDKNGLPLVAQHWEKYFQNALFKYNSIYKLEIDVLTPHVCRHTFCSNMARLGMNPKTLQYIMGHSDIGVTLNTYTHVANDDAAKDFFDVQQAQEVMNEVDNEEDNQEVFPEDV